MAPKKTWRTMTAKPPNTIEATVANFMQPNAFDMRVAKTVLMQLSKTMVKRQQSAKARWIQDGVEFRSVPLNPETTDSTSTRLRIAIAVGLTMNIQAHAMANAKSSPSTYLRYACMPPLCGRAAPSSANDAAPVQASSPPTSQAVSADIGEATFCLFDRAR